ncbi:hypothetical protein N656DRAFT_605542 [Canariomyces notabilis]|uniref:Uncharacterized protein n=1 Tax=Canariomyces notabilis TaxID=2074819 RepID=A0AAN6YTV9_9PEZI|nr:hypothetical protein N656DRAFT_605542 [Canariomyces arenarius]
MLVKAQVALVLCWASFGYRRGFDQVLPVLGHGQEVARPRDSDERQEMALQAQRKLFEQEHRQLEKKPGFGAIYGNTLETLVDEDKRRPSHEEALVSASNSTASGKKRVFTFNPYPKYNSPEWLSNHAPYVPCIGPTGRKVEDIRVYKGRPSNFPDPGFGSYSVLGLDPNICWERETRMGPYGMSPVVDKDGNEINWDEVSWGDLQRECYRKNSERFASSHPANEYITQDTDGSVDLRRGNDAGGESEHVLRTVGRFWRSNGRQATGRPTFGKARRQNKKVEARTALLLRSFTGKEYLENDKQVIRALITELSLRSGGEYEVFLFVHVRENEIDIWQSDEAYKKAIDDYVPPEFRSIAVLWNEAAVDRMYPKLTDKARKVHNGQFLPVQMFMQEFREFDFVWNWEMDSRVVGHHYDMLSKLGEFARKQPRRGIWERNERFYIPSFYGSYDSQFRATVENATAGESIWGPPNVPVVKPIGPKPPVATPEEDDYRWGVGEEADLIMLSPMFNPVNSGWVMRNQVWGYRSLDFPWGKLPRRTTIITQGRVSRKLLDVMHAEDLRGNHVASEMVTQTTALLHGLKAVYAPMPVYFDRAWSGAQLAKWFNGGPKGQSGSFGSAMGWGQEGRYLGSTWYFRAFPPQRLYNNWMGYEDTGIGGPEWEESHGRTCLPSMLLHPIKEVKPTEKGYATDSRLPYD